MIQQTGNCVCLSAKAVFGKMTGSERGGAVEEREHKKRREEEGNGRKEAREAPRK